jgi:hypothetical protein
MMNIGSSLEIVVVAFLVFVVDETAKTRMALRGQCS